MPLNKIDAAKEVVSKPKTSRLGIAMVEQDLEPQRTPPTPKTSGQFKTIIKRLRKTSPNVGYTEWFKILTYLKSTNHTDAMATAIDWSKDCWGKEAHVSTKGQPYQEGQIEKMWPGLDVDKSIADDTFRNLCAEYPIGKRAASDAEEKSQAEDGWAGLKDLMEPECLEALEGNSKEKAAKKKRPKPKKADGKTKKITAINPQDVVIKSREKPEPEKEPLKPKATVSDSVFSIVSKCASDIEPTNQSWLVPDFIPEFCCVALGGKPSTGKSTFYCQLVAMVTTGASCFPGVDDLEKSQVGSAVILQAEDSFNSTVVPRLKAAGADLSKVHFPEGVVHKTSQTPDWIMFDEYTEELKSFLEKLGDCRLLVIDPPASFLSGNVDSYKEADVRRALAPLASICEELRITVLLIIHLNKNTKGDQYLRFGGSSAWIALPRAGLMIISDDEKGERFCVPVKSNLAARTRGFSFCIKTAYVDGDVKTSTVAELAPFDDKRADDMAEVMKKPSEGVLEAVEFIRHELEGKGFVAVTDLQKAAKNAGHSWPQVRRASAHLSEKNELTKSREGEKHVWCLIAAAKGGTDAS